MSWPLASLLQPGAVHIPRMAVDPQCEQWVGLPLHGLRPAVSERSQRVSFWSVIPYLSPRAPIGFSVWAMSQCAVPHSHHRVDTWEPLAPQTTSGVSPELDEDGAAAKRWGRVAE